MHATQGELYQPGEKLKQLRVSHIRNQRAMASESQMRNRGGTLSPSRYPPPPRDIATSLSDEVHRSNVSAGVLPPLVMGGSSEGVTSAGGRRRASPVKDLRGGLAKPQRSMMDAYGVGGGTRQDRQRFASLFAPPATAVASNSGTRGGGGGSKEASRSYEASRKANKALLSGLMTEFHNAGTPLQFKDPAVAHRDGITSRGGAARITGSLNGASESSSQRAAAGASGGAGISREWDLDSKQAALVEVVAARSVSGPEAGVIVRPSTRQQA